MDDKIDAFDIESHLWKSANYLRNKIDTGDYKSYIFPLLFYKRICDVYDEEYQTAFEESGGDNEYASDDVHHRFHIPVQVHWNQLRKISKNVGLNITKSMRTIEKANPNTLYGIFGDANWGNKNRLSDETLVDLIEHFSKINLSNKTTPNDLMGTAYEYLIKKFADDSGHTAAEFYTNRTVVTLMTELLDPQPEESVYDPTCGTGGMLLECVNHLKRLNKEYRSTMMYGQEKNIITSTIARMNMLLHGFEDARIRRGDTLSQPMFLENDKLQQFDVILANPPYSVSKWNRKAFSRDPFGRNIYGTPPQSRADYAFLQHIVKSLSSNGRAAILFPHGVLFRDAERKIREGLVCDDKLEGIIGLGPNLFYNSPMKSCIVILNINKKSIRKNKVIFINATDQIEKHGTKNNLQQHHINHISSIFKNFTTIPQISYIASNEEIQQNQFLLNISTYIRNNKSKRIPPTKIIKQWFTSHKQINHMLIQFKMTLGG